MIVCVAFHHSFILSSYYFLSIVSFMKDMMYYLPNRNRTLRIFSKIMIDPIRTTSEVLRSQIPLMFADKSNGYLTDVFSNLRFISNSQSLVKIASELV